ncbi:hypothetical protein CONLIGDRAFT_389933 [Coniochaeta ligniaria NRRL 30616]|uniref:Uncharacterized protein n=1 Tax=Coniochaeta ligniaria NRRL 30616 TaxID=1408157 RepID=A0A1J7JHB3_9PEZI|nr:hypothetical protein CONLIGDRAFT_389933 [Coniochaeta ligniaria NRRL 30616]
MACPSALPSHANGWLQVIEDALTPLRRPMSDLLKVPGSKHSYETCQALIKQLHEQYKGKPIIIALHGLYPLASGLRSMEGAITNIAQGATTFGANPATLVWGILEYTLSLASTAVEDLEMIATLLAQFGTNLPQFDDFIDLYPRSERLQLLLREIYGDYIRFCVTAVQYLTQSKIDIALVPFLPTRWNKFQGQFSKITDSLNTHTAEFIHQTFLDGAQILSSVSHMVADIRSVLPEVQSTSKVVFPLFELPHARNPSFSCREDEIEALRTQLNINAGSVPTSCVIHGLGGVGKTQLAIEYAYRNRGAYDAIFWLNAEQDSELATDYASTARHLGLTKTLSDQDRCIDRVRGWLNGTDMRWLLIFDNIDNSAVLKAYWNLSATHGEAIFTTQNRAIVNDFRASSQLHMKPLVPRMGARFLIAAMKRKFDEDINVAEQISASVSGLPLALTIITGYVQGVDDDFELADFHKEFLENDRDFEFWANGEGVSMSQYSKNMLTVFALAVRKLPKHAKDLLNLISLLNPDSIQEEMLKLWSRSGRSRYIDVKRHLRSHHLVESDAIQSEKVLRIHRPVRDFVLHGLRQDYEHFGLVFAQAQHMVRKVFPRQTPWMNPVNHQWAEYEKYMPHIWSLWRIFDQESPPMTDSEELVTILCDAGNYPWEREQREEGLLVLSTAKAVLESRPGGIDKANHRVYISTTCLIACLLCGNGVTGRKAGREYFTEVMGLRKNYFDSIPPAQVTKDDRFLLANSYNDFACGLIHSSSYTEADEPLKVALALKRACGAEDEYKGEFAEAYKNHAYVHLGRDELEAAVAAMRHATHLALGAYGELTAACQLFRFHLACVLYIAGEPEESLQIHKAVLRVRKDQLFTEHHDQTLNSYYAVGFLLWKRHRLSDARENLAIPVAAAESAKWPMANVARATYVLSQVLRDLDDVNAEALEAKARKTLRMLLEQHHPDLLEMYARTEASDAMPLFDHLVSMHAGRFTVLSLDKY